MNLGKVFTNYISRCQNHLYSYWMPMIFPFYVMCDAVLIKFLQWNKINTINLSIYLSIHLWRDFKELSHMTLRAAGLKSVGQGTRLETGRSWCFNLEVDFLRNTSEFAGKVFQMAEWPIHVIECNLLSLIVTDHVAVNHIFLLSST